MLQRWPRACVQLIGRALFGMLVACAPASTVPALLRVDGETMGTTWSAQFADAPDLDRAAIEVAIQAELDEVIVQMSTWQPDSTISRYNAAESGSWHALPGAFAEVLQAALRLAEATDGRYDPTVGPLVEVWGFGAGAPRDSPPDVRAIALARDRVGWRRLRLDGAAPVRLLQPGGLHLDLSSIAEGYAVDRIGGVLERVGIDAYLVEIGGELRARGRRPDGAHWRVAIEQLDDDVDAPVVLALRDSSIATSGDYRKFFEYDGRRYSHTIDPHTGWPIDHDLAMVTVVAADSLHAGSVATALNVLGPERGFGFAVERDVAARFVIRDGSRFRIRTTPAFEALLTH